MSERAKPRRRIRRPRMLVIGLGALGLGAVSWTAASPSGSGDWAGVHSRMPRVDLQDTRVVVEDFRAFEYASKDTYEARYETRTFDLAEVESVWYVVTPFSVKWRGPAHTFLSFGFADSTYVAVSVEARREQGEQYSMLQGLLHRFEVIYVIGSERDLIGSRAIHSDDEVFVYPIRASRDAARSLFVEMMRRAEALRREPEFYNTLVNNCTTNILGHVNRVAPERIPYGPRILLPGYSDAVAHERGLIDTDLTLDEARNRFRVNELARSWDSSMPFSLAIRRAR